MVKSWNYIVYRTRFDSRDESLYGKGLCFTSGASMDRFLGIDFGDERIGLAISDELGITARGIEVISVSKVSKPLKRIVEIILEYKAAHIVIGLPLNMNGTEGAKAKDVRVFADRLIKASPQPIDIIFWDERLTTVQAENLLIEGGVRRKKRRQLIDKVAAVIILQSYLDSMNWKGGDP